MNPLFFGSSEQALFGVYHPPRTRDERDRGIVLCYPVGQEYMRAHRAFRQLAFLLARAGFPVLRFDYYGTGDSVGQSEEGNLPQWTKDVETAIDELKDNAAVDRVTLVGLRLGAALAAGVHARRPDVASTVLWDPVVEGSSYFAEVLELVTGSPAVPPATETVGIYGYAWTPGLRASVDQIGLDAYRAPPGGRVAVVVSEERESFQRLREHYSRQTDNLTYRCVPSPGDWSYIDAWGSALLPQNIIQEIVTHLSEERIP